MDWQAKGLQFVRDELLARVQARRVDLALVDHLQFPAARPGRHLLCGGE